MVYNNKFIAVIKCNGKILREINDGVVILPFGAEYSILLKNLDTRRAVIDLSVDGTDMLGGRRLVIDANSESELKGKMIDGVVKNHFKFIQKTAKIQNHRGDKVDDGIIRVKFGFERVQFLSFNHGYPHHTYFGNRGNDIKYGSSAGNPNEFDSQIVSSSMFDSNPHSRNLSKSFEPQAEEGITVPGSETNQQFQSTTVGSIEDHGVIIIQLKGTDKFDEPVSVPLTVQSKIECPTCGTKSKSGTKYCPECGTNIQI
jgi:hypothetical protein